MSLALLDEVGALLSAASTTNDTSARVVFIAEARIRVEAARRKTEQLDTLTSAAEADLARAMADAVNLTRRGDNK